MKTNSPKSHYQGLRSLGYALSIGLTLVCFVAFIYTCRVEAPVYDAHYEIVGVKKVFNPMSLVYLFSCIPTIALGALLGAVADIGDDVKDIKALHRDHSEPTASAALSGTDRENRNKPSTPEKKDLPMGLILAGLFVAAVVLILFTSLF